MAGLPILYAPRAGGALRNVLAAVVLLFAPGCASNLYHAHKLPPEYLAPPVENVQTLDLSTLATSGVDSQTISKGDVLDLAIYAGYEDERTRDRPVRVAEDGTIIVPLVGPVPISGLELEVAEQVIASAAVERGVYRSPTVTLTMRQRRANKITVVGAVARPGVYDLPRGNCGLLGALVAAGGLAPNAGTDVEIRHPNRAPPDADVLGSPSAVQPASFDQGGGEGGPTSIRLNLLEAAAQGAGGLLLNDGDVVMVSKRDPAPVQVIGLVKRPGQYPMPLNQDLRVLDSLALAGGWTSPVADKVHVIRQIPGRTEPVVIQVSLREAKMHGQGNLRLAPGDIVSVEQTTATTMLSAITRFVRISVGGSARLFSP